MTMQLIILLTLCAELAFGSVVIGPIAGGQSFSLFHNNGDIRLKGQLGNLPAVIQAPTSCGEGCLGYSDYANLTIEEDGDCTTIQWTSPYAKELRDCFLIENHWYGGGETKRQYWPIEGQVRRQSAFVTADSFANPDMDYGGVSETYWLVSSGVGLFVDQDIPLFVSTNDDDNMSNHFCVAAKRSYPFKEKSGDLKLRYTMCTADNVKEAHLLMQEKFWDKPTGLPDTGMLLKPFWSTWAQFHKDVNESIVVGYAQNIVAEGFGDSSHVEIDDDWESCYGEMVFHPQKFPDVGRMVTSIKNLGFKVTLWVHPFINMDCPSFNEAHNAGYFVKTEKGKTGITSWWQPGYAGLIDFSNEAAITWWVARLEKLREDFGIDSFKFDAGETNWMPHSSLLTGNKDLQPNLYSKVFAEAMASFGGLVEVRAVRQAQRFPMFVRMLDKDSHWGYDNGLKSMIPTLLHFGIQGYPFILPDMIGGNAYGGIPSRQLYIRWMQSNIFMPSAQLSIAPWEYDAEVVEICQRVLQIRKDWEGEILAAAEESVQNGYPINRPMWWVDPTDVVTYTIDDQYMMGDTIMVAPVLEEDANSRNIYLPRGRWYELSDLEEFYHQGPMWLENYPANISTVPVFFKGSDLSP